MVGFSKNIIRGMLIGSYCLIIALMVYGISAIYSYFNTGADRSTMLHTEIKKAANYLPKVIWSPINNEGRTIDHETLKAIEKDYLDGWFVKHVAYKTNTTYGLHDYYTDNARKNLVDIIELNTSENTTIEATTLEHKPTLEFFSEDGQLAVITDKDVIEYKRIFKNKKLVLETTEKSTYKIVLLLEDGFWRIRHMVKETTDNYEPENVSVSTHDLQIKGINYYPKDTPWNMFGDQFDATILANDFNIIKEAGLNSIRIFIPYEDFGKAHILQDKLDKLKVVLDTAENKKLKVMVTLFDFYGDYSILDWTLNHRHAESIVSTFKDHSAILAWDIKNEPNLDFESRGKTNVMSWLKHMSLFIKSIDKKHPVTIGWSNTKSAKLLQDHVDFVSFHFYEDINDLDTAVKELKTAIPNKPIVMQEFGLSSNRGFWNPFGNSEKSQADYHKKAQAIISDNQLPYMSWTLYDFNNIPKEVTGRLPWRKNAQKHYGFIDLEGNPKESFNYISNPE